jgi:hypothetical protein
MNVFIESLWAGYGASIARGFDFLGPAGTIRTSDRIAIKPNLTFPTYRPGVMTSLDALTALVTYLKNFTDKITICESDSGGYNPFSMDEVFRNTGITEFALKTEKRNGERLAVFNYTANNWNELCTFTRLRNYLMFSKGAYVSQKSTSLWRGRFYWQSSS